MENQVTPTNFIATVYGNLTPLNNSAFSKARLKIFYKGLNRNGSYITDEIAEKLLTTLPGTPIVGSFDGDLDDFTGHIAPETNKAYGFVPQDMNFKWEMFLDPDGVYRTYACTDIILWTGRYPIASRIVGKSHSMELNPDTVEGEWTEIDDEFCFQFTNAEFFGLCVLGDEYEPCFEGSSFYELHKKEEKSEFSKEVKEMFTLYKSELDNADENQTGGQEMEEKENSVEEEVVETPAVEEEVVEEETPTTKPEAEEEENNEEETDSQEEEETETEEESEEDEEEKEEESEEEEVEEETETEESEEPDLNSQLAEKDAEIANLKAQLEELSSYKAQKVLEEKEKVLEAYTSKLSEEEVAEFKNKINDYSSAAELKKEIAVCILDKEEVAEEGETEYVLTNNHKEEYTGAAAIVARYAKK